MSQILTKLLQDIDTLIPASMRHVPGQSEGLALRMGTTGVYLSHLDVIGLPKNFTSAHRTWMQNVLIPKFPNLDVSAIMGRSSESIRRFNSVVHRLAAAQKGASSGNVIALESLDLEGSTPRPIIPAGQMSATEPSRIPRAFTYVQLQPDPPRRIVIFSDLPLKDPLFNKTIIPDEIIVSYPVSDDELKAIKAAKPPAVFTPLKEIDKAVKTSADIRITCGDINKELVDEQLIRHFEKTMRGLVTAATTVFKDLGITPTDKVTAVAADSYLHSGEAKFADPASASMQRRTARGTKISMTVEFVVTTVNNELRFVPTKLNSYFSKTAAQLAQRLSLSMVVVATALEEVLNKLPKKKP